ncbi:MAG TPA: pyridine nucleotide-disulfide oxidoreductase [Gemmatimonadetes bacterium]|nr:pyridine nucleotide-disulfide oxidoreductase [Gemmatimonadota bacterium]
MTEHSDELIGPDLTQGLEVSSIHASQLIAGHAFGEPVLLVHVEPNWFAVGGKCTHYGAPLDQGILVSETIRCPWHHACFELRDGAASRAPALNDLPSYDVAVENNVVRVTRKRDRGQLKAEGHRARGSPAPERVLFEEKPTTGPESVVIIGGGAAGNACAEMLRREAYRGPVTIIDPDPDVPYDRPNLSKDYLAGNAPEEWLPLHPREFYVAQHIEILSGLKVTAIDLQSRAVHLSDGSSRNYGCLLIATGATPIRLDVPGGDRIAYLRTLGDCRAIIAKFGAAKTAVVIGASFIGLEVAASLVSRGLKVSVVAPETLPLERVLGTELGTLVKTVHEQQGVTFCLGRTVTAIEEKKVVLDDGSRVDADLVVAGVGVRPNLQLAESAGLTLDNGLAVNEFLETSASGVFAAGDVARWPDAYSDLRLRIEHWVVAERQGQVVARNMLGARDCFDDIPFFWSAHYDKLSIQYIGHVERWDETRIEGDVMKMDCAVSYMVGGRRRAMATINRDRKNLETEVQLETELLLKPPPAVTLEATEA